MSNSRDVGVYLENLLNLTNPTVDVYDWGDAVSPAYLTHVRVTMVHHNTDDYTRIFLLLSDERRYVIQIFREDL